MAPDHWDRYEFCRKNIKGNSILDVACGCGYGTAMLAKNQNLQVKGLDIDSSAIDWANRYYSENARFIKLDKKKWDINKDTIDTVISLETIEHISPKDMKYFFDNLFSILKPQGRLILSTPLNENESRLNPENPFHIREYSRDELSEIIEDQFLIVSRWTQISNFSKYYKKISGIKNKSLKYRTIQSIPPKIRKLIRDFLIELTDSRKGSILQGKIEMGAVQIIIAESKK